MRHERSVEKRLIDTFDRVIREDHPNPDRTGCPGDAALRQLAFQPGQFRSESTLDHITHCAPCLDQLKKLRASVPRNKKGEDRHL